MQRKYTKKMPPILLIVLGFNIGFLYVPNSFSYDIVKDFSLPTTVQYDDNVTLSSSNSQGAFRYIATPTISLSKVDEVNNFNLKTSLNIVRSSASENLILDREDPMLAASWDHNFNRGNWSLNAGYLRTSTRVSELEQTGLVFRDGNSIRRDVGASLVYELTDKINTTYTLDYVNQTYADSSLSDFESYAAGIQANYQYTEKLDVYTNLGYSKFYNERTGQIVALNQDPKQNLKRYSLGMKYAYSPAMTLNFSFGGNKVSTGDSGWVASGEVNYQVNEYTKFDANYSRGNYASGLGGFQNSDNLNVGLTRIISDFDDVGCSFFWSRNRSLNTATTRNFIAFYNHDWTPNWSSRVSFQHRGLSSGGSASATGAQLGFTLSYNAFNF